MNEQLKEPAWYVEGVYMHVGASEAECCIHVLCKCTTHVHVHVRTSSGFTAAL